MKKEYDFSKGRREPVIPIPAGKTRITIRIDDDVLEWFREQVDDRSQEIVDALERAGSITLRGPQGQEVSIASETQVKNSAA